MDLTYSFLFSLPELVGNGDVVFRPDQLTPHALCLQLVLLKNNRTQHRPQGILE